MALTQILRVASMMFGEGTLDHAHFPLIQESLLDGVLEVLCSRVVVSGSGLKVLGTEPNSSFVGQMSGSWSVGPATPSATPGRRCTVKSV